MQSIILPQERIFVGSGYIKYNFEIKKSYVVPSGGHPEIWYGKEQMSCETLWLDSLCSLFSFAVPLFFP